MNPCEIGFKCPYLGYAEDDYEPLCCYPRLIKDIPEDCEDSFGLVGEVCCELMEYDSEIYTLLNAYNQSAEIGKMVEDFSKKWNEDIKIVSNIIKESIKRDSE